MVPSARCGCGPPLEGGSEAIRQYLDLEAWQIGEIGKALTEADAGDFASDDEVAAVIARYAG
ncbi:MAG: hypothetical protein Q8O52_21460 [Sulfuritalea sp.]|nr:hypothetical protein [Sulfuritalea sp.]